jgi:Ca2+-transporting ATPase
MTEFVSGARPARFISWLVSFFVLHPEQTFNQHRQGERIMTEQRTEETTWHTQPADAVLATLGSTLAQGLSPQEAADRLARDGYNELIDKSGRSIARMLWEQFTATMVLILIVAAVISAFLQKWQEASAILAIVVLFALLGFFQEYRAERAMAALKKLAVPNVRVRRGGQVQELSARELVAGDIVLLEAGNLLPADTRLVDVANLRIQEAALTGESEAVEKNIAALDRHDAPLGDRRNMAFMGTVAAYGRGAAVVVNTGMRTELGKIANLLQATEDTQTPLQRRLDQVGKLLALVGVGIAAIIALFGVWRGESLSEMFLVAVSVAVAIVPEGLPAVVTITLAIGARRMLQRNALIRKLPAVETLGSVTTICSDKTGTLTENRMTVTVLDVAGQQIDLTEHLNPTGQADLVVSGSGVKDQRIQTPELELLLLGGTLCTDAELQEDPTARTGRRFVALGDPTEGALVIAAAQFGLLKPQLEQALPRRQEVPFDSERKRMTTAHALSGDAPALIRQVAQGGHIAFTKGSPDGLLEIASHVLEEGEIRPLGQEHRQRIEQANASLAQNGMRVLGVAFRPLTGTEAAASLEEQLIFIGLFGIIDPPRQEVKKAVAQCVTAGIRPVMITGDHPLTARHIARDLGITQNDRVISGVELDKLDEPALEAAVEQVNVFARVSPEHKLRIVNALQRRGHVVAMTGDGVNDAPALKRADIGVAMGITGTDVAKEAAEMVLRDDNFATIVAAVEEGRVIYDNIRKFVKFSIGGNIGKVLVMILAPMLALLWPASPLGALVVPLLPLQLLWLNLLTDGLLGIGLGVEPAERGVMRRPPIARAAGIFAGGLAWSMLLTGVLIGALALGIGLWQWRTGNPHWQTMMFTTLAFAQVWQAMGGRSSSESLLRIGLLSNKPLLLLVLLVIVLQLAAIYIPALATFLQTTTLTLGELLLCVAISALVLLLSEVEKLVTQNRTSSTPSA